jgi:hypothetical protein
VSEDNDDIVLSAETSIMIQIMAETFISFCREQEMGPRVTVATMAAAIAIAIKRSNSPWDQRVQGYLIREITRQVEEITRQVEAD